MADQLQERERFEATYARLYPTACWKAGKFDQDRFGNYEDTCVEVGWAMWGTALAASSSVREEALRRLIADDGYAASFQSMAQYRSALLKSQPAEQRQWIGLCDSDWMNIVNHDHAYETFDKESAVHEAVKRTEAKLKELNAAAQPSSQPTDAEIVAAAAEHGFSFSDNSFGVKYHFTVGGLRKFFERLLQSSAPLVKPQEDDLEARNKVAAALGLPINGLNKGQHVSFAWKYPLGMIEECVRATESELFELRAQRYDEAEGITATLRNDRIEELEAALSQQSAATRDAERYRWLRDYHIGDDPGSINLASAKKPGLDAAIDAAIHTEAGKP